MKVLTYPALTFIGYTLAPIPHATALKELIKSLLIDWYDNGHRMILTGTRPGYERLVIECARELVESYECQGYYIRILNCDPKPLTDFRPLRYIEYPDSYLPIEDAVCMTEFLIGITSLLFLYHHYTHPDPLTEALSTATRGTAIPIYNLYAFLEDNTAVRL